MSDNCRHFVLGLVASVQLVRPVIGTAVSAYVGLDAWECLNLALPFHTINKAVQLL